MIKIIKWIGYILIVFGMYQLFLGSPLSGNPLRWSVVIMGFIVYFIGIAFSYAASSLSQKKVNSKAKEIVERVLKGLSESYALYLRSFEIDGNLFINKEHQNIFDVDSSLVRIGIDPVERVLGDAVNPTLPLVGLGGKKAYITSFGQVGLLDDWKEKIKVLIEKAVIVFIIPAPNEGTLFEIGLIANQLNKTVFIMPSNDLQYVGSYSNFEDFWEETKSRVYDEHGIKLPLYDPRGAVFCYDNDANLVLQNTTTTNPKSVAQAINFIMRG